MHDLTALREALGKEALIRGDANGAWTPTQALQEIRALEPIGLDWVEQPVIEADFDGFEHVARLSRVPLCIDQGVNTSQLAFEVIRRRLASVICSDIHRVGGIQSFREMAAMAHLANMAVCRHAGPEFGISATAPRVLTYAQDQCLGDCTMSITSCPLRFDSPWTPCELARRLFLRSTVAFHS